MNNKTSKYQSIIKIATKHSWIAITFWTLLLIALFLRDFESTGKVSYRIIHKEAETNFKLDESFRKWTASHGGFYVPVTRKTQPSPYLSKLKKRDVVTNFGDTLTLINPARALRLMSTFYQDESGVTGHITSLKLLRPENTPDEWEKKALLSFEDGIKEAETVTTVNNEPVYRLIKPLFVQKSCLKCHGKQGYKVGDIRGGVSITIPIKNYLNIENKIKHNKAIAYFILWLFGIILSLILFGRMKKLNAVIEISQKTLKESNEALEQKVKERTQRLQEINLKLSEEIHEREKTDLVLKISEERYKGIVHSTVSCIAVYQPVDDCSNFMFIEFNPMAEKAEKIKKEEVIGRLVTDVFPGVIEFGLFKVFQEVCKTGNPQHFPIKVYKDNRIVGFRENYVYKLSSGEIVALYQDVTEQKRSEQIQKILYNISNAVTTSNNLKDLIAQIQKEVGKVIDASNFYVALYDKYTDMLTMPYYNDEKDFFTTAQAEKTLSKIVIESNNSMLVNHSMKEELVKAGKLKYQGTRSKVWLGVPLRVKGEVIGVAAVQNYYNEQAYSEPDKKILEFIADQISISIHRKKVEEDLKDALLKAEESDRLKSAFLANMSHEIRTPMNGILGFASLLKEPDLTGADIKRFTDIINSSGERMLNIINNLIDISKIEAGQVETIEEPNDINKQLKYHQVFFNPEAQKKQLHIEHIPGLPDKEAIIETDSKKLFSILTNLIKNAIKYTHKGSIEFGYNKKNDFLEFYVKDTGIGIPKDRQEAIFDRFVQADIEDKAVYEGAGLGLSITKAFVEMLGGKIWLESVLNQGSCFYFTIPYKPVGGLKEDSTIHKKDSPVKDVTNNKLKILIVDDEPVSDMYLTAILKDVTGNLFHARTGQEAIDIYSNNRDINIILMDIKMPGMNGLKATKEIRKLSRKVIVIAQTAYALVGDREKAIEAGCNDYISKPINKKELLKIINKYK